MQYEGMIYRPPSEASSLIVQVTVGCAYNQCTFCSMYKGDRFRVRALSDILDDLKEAQEAYGSVSRIFLADGDALCLSTEKLLIILNSIRRLFPQCQRVGIYGSARDVLSKTGAELLSLKEAGLGIVYLGAESGSPAVLKAIKKNASRQELIDSVLALKKAGLASSVTFISGLGGRENWQEHALMTATMINAMQPTYASVLTLMVEEGAPLREEIASGRFEVLSASQVLEEMECLLANIQVVEPVIFRSNHPSNYLSLRGTLPEDQEAMLAQIRQAKQEEHLLRPEHFRML